MPRDNYSPARHAWLSQLDKWPDSRRPKGNIGKTCQKLGWAKWCWWGEGEELTDAGRVKLAEWNKMLSRRGDGEAEYASWIARLRSQ